MIDHTDIIPSTYLPTRVSYTIEWYLKNIIGIDNIFIVMNACKNEQWFLHESTEPTHNDFIHHCPAQSCFLLIIAKWVATRMHAIPIHFPKWILPSNRLSNRTQATTNDYGYLEDLMNIKV